MSYLINIKGRMYTRNLVPGVSVYEEKLVKQGKDEYREWTPKRSKLGAGLKKGIKNPINENTSVLYLGAASGTTVSHVSDMAPKGVIYAVEFAPEPIKSLIMLAKKRKNIIPIFADANHPEVYEFASKSDVVFQDIAQKNQAEIFTKNCLAYLKKDGVGVLAIKSRSIDVTKHPEVVFKQVEKELYKTFKILDMKRLEPFERDHKIYIVKFK
ncbi:MAG TPA: fibrillarin-like rRNA/tRNA 2'-O-methyltransferase [Candidatus Nanoarchaeia archaeon]|nr:fibrillarin-like rRNA/tRNA 2'-O-methyltransferase [Candidatus Nanoarchaeia archaeon]